MNYYGKKVYGGIVIGNVVEIKRQFSNIKRDVVKDKEKEIIKFNKAKSIVREQLERLYKNVAKNIGEEEAYVFKVHMMLLEDTDYNESIIRTILKKSVSARYAISLAEEKFVDMFLKMDDDYMKIRAADIKDVSSRLQETLNDMSFEDIYNNMSKPSVIVADDLLPSEIIKLDNENILAVVCREGAINSHTSIIARAMNIPCMIQVKNLPINIDGKKIVVDGFSDIVILEPSEKILNKYNKQINRLDSDKSNTYKEMLGKRVIDSNGKSVRIYANCNFYDEAKKAFENDAEGIGLFRTEFLYIDKDKLPNEKQQFEYYKNILQMYNDRPQGERKVCIRVFDIGADKKCKNFHIPYESNPALGCRGIRFALKNVNVLKTQLRALLRASIFGKLEIMFPLITTLDEVKQIKKILEEVKKELAEQNIKINDNIEIGIMIETPAAVMISDRLAKEVDFFSIGSNDLMQYTLAADRTDINMKNYYSTYHEAIFEMIKMTVNNAHNNGIWVGLCGDLACDTSVVKQVVDMGIDELSVPVNKILEVRNVLLKD